uniref:NADH-ubiquinone oxidoreductase chain 4 n=1 Tax=Scraptia sp. SCR03 TaxID=1205584 RepID=A0A0S2MQJ0_9CUCU|nr:NADH deshydrogenase subunit 4 [Scraptia sp. SCR03]
MMSLIMYFLFLIPLIFLNKFWLIQWSWFLIFSMFLKNFAFSYDFMYLYMSLGIDLLSFYMILLSIWICGLMLMASEKIFCNKMSSVFFYFNMLVLTLSLILLFCSMNLFFFYLFFEISLIPTLILIMGWGYQPERLQAGVYLLFYTLFASLPMMIAIFLNYKMNNSLDFVFLNCTFMSLMMFISMNLVFFIKIPMYLLHLWLPKAHVEAPVSGSMILAGIMLKLGGYGLMRVFMMFLNFGLVFNIYLISLSLVGGVIVSFICIVQSDMKSLIAYSSVAHMGMAFSGILTMNYWGFQGCLVMMIAHGLCSSGLFSIANISYERVMSRSLYLNKGMINLIPSLSLWWFLLVSSNMAAPPSLNLLGEIMLINSIIGFFSGNMGFLIFISFFSAVYSLYLFSFSQHGKFSMVLSMSFVNVREYLLLMLHWLPLNILILKWEMLMI